MGYKKYEIEAIVSVSPLHLSGGLDEIITEELCKDYEGKIDKNIGIIIAVTDILERSIGEIVPEDPNVFFKVRFLVITYLPKLHEITYGEVTQATDFGAFIKIGPIEGLCHISQVMSDFNSYNPELPGFVAKGSKRSLVVGDEVITRVVNISLKRTLADTKIGLTMRPLGLGKPEWQKKDLAKEKKKNKSKTKTSKKSTKKKVRGGRK